MFDRGAIEIRKTLPFEVFHGDRHVEDLCNAIIIQATKDYRAAAMKYYNSDCKSDKRTAESTMKSIERFFVGEWCNLICKDNGEYILHRLQREIEEAIA